MEMFLKTFWTFFEVKDIRKLFAFTFHFLSINGVPD